MSTPARFGTNPWQQTNWDARAAANFIGGGAGGGLIVSAALSGAQGIALAVPLALGLALIAAGLLSVFAEIGRPLRAVNVIINPRTSWMSREALVAPFVFATGAAAIFGYEICVYPAAAFALAFVYCQGRMLQASRGIPAWRTPALLPLMVTTGLAEGAGLWLATAAFTSAPAMLVLAWFGLVVIARVVLFRRYRKALGGGITKRAAATLDHVWQALLLAGTIVPLALAAVAIVAGQLWIAAIGGVAVAAIGAFFKLRLVLAAGHNQGFAIAHLPVRGARI
jgi:phenylacetyl-CoA:acceptor oxidoreductase subunit 2